MSRAVFLLFVIAGVVFGLPIRGSMGSTSDTDATAGEPSTPSGPLLHEPKRRISQESDQEYKRSKSTDTISSTSSTRTEHPSSALFNAIQNNQTDVVDALLNTSFIDPILLNLAFIKASEYGRVQIFDVLVQRVDPSVNDNDAIKRAAENGHVEIVERLLRFPSVDPAVNENQPLNDAAFEGQVDVCMLLIQDQRVKNVPIKMELARILASILKRAINSN
jgi:hypothetical protein